MKMKTPRLRESRGVFSCGFFLQKRYIFRSMAVFCFTFLHLRHEIVGIVLDK